MSISGIFPMDKWDRKSRSILTDLPPEVTEIIYAHTSEQRHQKGEIIFREGATATGIFFIREGKVKKYKSDKNGNEHIIYVANAGEIIGYHAIISGERYPDCASALEDTCISFIPKEDFIKAIETSNILSNRLLKLLSHEFTVFVNSVSHFAQRSAKERLATQLIILREKYKGDYQPGIPVEINLSREDLANMVGIARENIVRLLKELKQDGAIITNGRKIIVTDIHKLARIANN